MDRLQAFYGWHGAMLLGLCGSPYGLLVRQYVPLAVRAPLRPLMKN